jgi:ribonuclease BN (tRNA processing enzyme)
MKIKPIPEKKVELHNKGKLQFIFAGVGSAFSKRNNQTNVLLIHGKDHLLIDCGNTCSRALLALGIPITQIRNFLITHSHADHIGGLEEVILMNRYVTREKPTIVISETYQHILWDMSLRGGAAYNEEKGGDILTFSDFWHIIRPEFLPKFPRNTQEANIGELNIKIMRTKHIPDTSDTWETSFWSCGVIINDKILFTSDTRYDFKLVDYFESKYNFEAIFHDCQFFTGGVHASLEELKQFPPAIKKKMYLSHYGDNWEQFEDKVQEYGFAGLAREKVIYEFD